MFDQLSETEWPSLVQSPHTFSLFGETHSSFIVVDGGCEGTKLLCASYVTVCALSARSPCLLGPAAYFPKPGSSRNA